MGKQWQTLFSWAPKSLQRVTAVIKLKRCFLLRRKAVINLDSVLKSRDITLWTSLCSKSYGFPSSHVWMWELDHKESWSSEMNTDALELWCWRLLRVSWTAWRSNKLILKEINSESILAGLMLRLKLQYFGHLIRRADSLEKTLMLGKIEGRRREWQRARGLDGITNLVNMSLSKFMKDRRQWRTGSLACCSPWGHKELDMTEQLNDNIQIHF